MVTMDYTDRELTIRELKIAYQEWGNPDGIPILALHGFGLSGHMYDEFAKRIPDSFRLIALDQRGHGDSDWSPEGDYSRSAFVEDLEDFREALGIEQFILIGHSMGGLNAVSYAVKYPERVESLVLVDVGPEAAKEGVDNIMRFTQGPDELEFEEFVEMAHRFNQRRTLDNIRERMRHRLKKMENGKWTWKFDKRFREDAKSLRIGNEDGPSDSWELFRSVQAPTLLLRGEESDVLEADVALKSVTEMQRCRLVAIPGAGHSVPGDAPDAFTEAVETFINDVRDGQFPAAAASTDDDPLAPTLDELVESNGNNRPSPDSLAIIAGCVAAIAAAAAVLYFLYRRRRTRSPRAEEIRRIRARTVDVQHAAVSAGRRGAKQARKAAQNAHVAARGRSALRSALNAREFIDNDRAADLSRAAISRGGRLGEAGVRRSRGVLQTGLEFASRRRRARRRKRFLWR